MGSACGKQKKESRVSPVEPRPAPVNGKQYESKPEPSSNSTEDDLQTSHESAPLFKAPAKEQGRGSAKSKKNEIHILDSSAQALKELEEDSPDVSSSDTSFSSTAHFKGSFLGPPAVIPPQAAPMAAPPVVTATLAHSGSIKARPRPILVPSTTCLFEDSDQGLVPTGLENNNDASHRCDVLPPLQNRSVQGTPHAKVLNFRDPTLPSLISSPKTVGANGALGSVSKFIIRPQLRSTTASPRTVGSPQVSRSPHFLQSRESSTNSMLVTSAEADSEAPPQLRDCNDCSSASLPAYLHPMRRQEQSGSFANPAGYSDETAACCGSIGTPLSATSGRSSLNPDSKPSCRRRGFTVSANFSNSDLEYINSGSNVTNRHRRSSSKVQFDRLQTAVMFDPGHPSREIQRSPTIFEPAISAHS
eukprot:ANDGO_04060.mRNA.1 hypothetical protein